MEGEAGIDTRERAEYPRGMVGRPINTIPEKTLAAFADHGKVGPSMPQDGGDADAVIAACRRAGIDDAALATQLQREGAAAFSKSWHELLSGIRAKSQALAARAEPASAA